MKKLQNNYTTIEQSKRLLELGVPVDSADIVYYNTPDSLYDPYIITEQSQLQRTKEGIGTPCWSAGRLIEIYEIVGENAGQCVTTTKGTSRIENLVKLYEENATLLDFSKLEE